MGASAAPVMDAYEAPVHELAEGLSDDDLYPRDEEHRYRIYGVIGHQRSILAATPDAGGVGVALITIHEDQKSVGRTLADLGRIGVLDTMPNGRPSAKGEWVVLPYDRRTT
jgi:hypothetical protein